MTDQVSNKGRILGLDIGIFQRFISTLYLSMVAVNAVCDAVYGHCAFGILRRGNQRRVLPQEQIGEQLPCHSQRNRNAYQPFPFVFHVDTS